MTKYRALAEKLYQNLRWSRLLEEEHRKRIEAYEDVITHSFEVTLMTWDNQ